MAPSVIFHFSSLISIFFCNRIYRDKLAYLKQQLEQLEQGLHPDYLRKLKKLETVFKDRFV